MAKIFVTLNLMNGDTVTIDEIDGGILLRAGFVLGPVGVLNPMLLAFEVSSIAVKKDGKSVGMEYMKNLLMDDLNLIFESVNSQLMKISK